VSEVELVERALYFANTRMGEVVREPGWIQVTLPGAKTDYRNLVLRSVLADDDADAAIERAKAHFAGVGVDFRWWITPSSRPADLDARLARHGLWQADEVAAMLAVPRDFPGADAPDVEVRAVAEDELDAYADVAVRGWGGPPQARARFRASAQAAMRTGGGGFVARWRGEPAGAAELAFFDGGAHFSGSVVLPAFRRRGIYRALIDARMRAVRARGAPLVTNLCRAGTSAPICRRLGFRDVCAMRIFSSAPRRSSSPS